MIPRPQNDAILPRTGSRRLLGAILERAMRDATEPLGSGSTSCTAAEQARARAWFDDGGTEPMSFRWLCAVLDLDADAVRQRVASSPVPSARTA